MVLVLAAQAGMLAKVVQAGAMLLGLASVVLLCWLALTGRLRRGDAVAWWRVLAGAGATYMLALTAAIAGDGLPDALDRLPAPQRASAEPVLEASLECGVAPFARVIDVGVDSSPGRVWYTCGITHLGLFSLSGQAYCRDGEWHAYGPAGLRILGRCDDI